MSISGWYIDTFRQRVDGHVHVVGGWSVGSLTRGVEPLAAFGGAGATRSIHTLAPLRERCVGCLDPADSFKHLFSYRSHLQIT